MVMEWYDLQAKAGPVPGIFKCSQRKLTLLLCLSIKMALTDSISPSGVHSACHKFLKLSMSFRAAHIQASATSNPRNRALHLSVLSSHFKRVATVTGFQSEISPLFLTMKTRPSLNRLRLGINGPSTRVLFRGPARWRTLAALPRKVLCSGASLYISHQLYWDFSSH